MTLGDSAVAIRIAVSLPCEALAQGTAGLIRQVWMSNHNDGGKTGQLKKGKKLNMKPEGDY
jgi:hypothetical protein